MSYSSRAAQIHRDCCALLYDAVQLVHMTLRMTRSHNSEENNVDQGCINPG